MAYDLVGLRERESGLELSRWRSNLNCRRRLFLV